MQKFSELKTGSSSGFATGLTGLTGSVVATVFCGGHRKPAASERSATEKWLRNDDSGDDDDDDGDDSVWNRLPPCFYLMGAV